MSGRPKRAAAARARNTIDSEVADTTYDGGSKAAPKPRGGKAVAAKRPAADSDGSDGGDEAAAPPSKQRKVAKPPPKRPAPRAKPAPPPKPAPTCCDAATHGVLETLLLRGALHAVDVARLGCVSRYWRHRSGGELKVLSAAYKASLKDRPAGADLGGGVQDEPCARCGKFEPGCMGLLPRSGLVACSDHFFTRPDTCAFLNVDALGDALISATAAKRAFYLTPAELRPLPNYSVRSLAAASAGVWTLRCTAIVKTCTVLVRR